jgi:hypothetical protein
MVTLGAGYRQRRAFGVFCYSVLPGQGFAAGTAVPAILQITILNAQGLLGTLLPPVQLQWSATVTQGGSIVQ